MKKLLFSLALVGSFSLVNAQSVIWMDDFEDQDISDWTLMDEDGDGFNFIPYDPSIAQTGERNYMSSQSYDFDAGSLTPDNWTISPAINVASFANLSLSYLVGAQDPDYADETYTVYVSTGNTMEDFLNSDISFSENIGDDPNLGELVDRTLDLTSFDGEETIYIAFRHHDSEDMFYINFDDVTVTGEEGEPNEYCIPDPLLCDDGDIITNVTFAGINNDSDCSPNGFGDYTETVAPAFVVAGETYDISLTIGNGWYEKVSMWIDFNNNGVFDADERYDVVEGDTGGTLTNTIIIPEGVADGVYRLRIYLSAAGSTGEYPQDPCVDETVEMYGEIEDYMVEVGTLGIDDLSSSALTLYPNPVTDAFKLNLPQSFNSSKVTVTVSDMTGKTVKNFGSSTSYNVSDLASGVYVVTISDGKNVQTKKIIIK